MEENRLVQPANIKDSDVRDFVVFDTETTGLYPDSEKIIEIGAVRFHNGEPVDTFHSLINPEKHIPAFISDLTHISDSDVADARYALIQKFYRHSRRSSAAILSSATTSSSISSSSAAQEAYCRIKAAGT